MLKLTSISALHKTLSSDEKSEWKMDHEKKNCQHMNHKANMERIQKTTITLLKLRNIIYTILSKHLIQKV